MKTQKPRTNPRICGGILVFLLFVCTTAACTGEARNPVKTKVFTLNPSEYIGSKVELSGRVTQKGPGDAYFTLEDDSGRVLATTERLESPTHCPANARIAVSGRLARLNSTTGLYFSIDEVLECN